MLRHDFGLRGKTLKMIADRSTFTLARILPLDGSLTAGSSQTALHRRLTNLRHNFENGRRSDNLRLIQEEICSRGL